MLLIVDDDPRFLQAAEELLNRGDGVLLAGSTQHAKELLASFGEMFSAAIVAVDRPGLDGFSLIGEMRRRYPNLPAIAVSGDPEDRLLECATDLGAVAAFCKPITPEWNRAIEQACRKSA